MNAFIILYHNGDFTTRSNEVETAYRRINPDDWDDDGIANERDLNPLLCDGDFYGVAKRMSSGMAGDRAKPAARRRASASVRLRRRAMANWTAVRLETGRNGCETIEL